MKSKSALSKIIFKTLKIQWWDSTLTQQIALLWSSFRVRRRTVDWKSQAWNMRRMGEGKLEGLWVHCMGKVSKGVRIMTVALLVLVENPLQGNSKTPLIKFPKSLMRIKRTEFETRPRLISPFLHFEFICLVVGRGHDTSCREIRWTP